MNLAHCDKLHMEYLYLRCSFEYLNKFSKNEMMENKEVSMQLIELLTKLRIANEG